MTGIRTQTLALIGVLGVSLPVLFLVARMAYAALVPTPASVVVLDAVILGAGVLGTTAMLGSHLHSAIARPVTDVQRTMATMTEGHLDERCAISGPAEVQALAQAAHALAEETERRLSAVTQASGVAAMASVLTGVAHEVSNAASSMRSSAHVLALRQAVLADEKSAAATARLARGLDRLEETVAALREAGASSGPRDPVRLVRAALIASKRALISCDVSIHADDAGTVDCQPAHIVEALVALLQNSAEAGASVIRVSARRASAGFEFVVEDDGGGFSPAILRQAHLAFVTTKPGRRGLGLHHVAATAREHGGSLLVENTAEGTRATLLLGSAPSGPGPRSDSDGGTPQAGAVTRPNRSTRPASRAPRRAHHHVGR